MPVVRSRGATKKLGPVSFGSKMVKFEVNKHQFSVHEDLICSSSNLFKLFLQDSRKMVEGNCSICHEPMKAEKGDITFCRKACGQNFHEKCYEDWTQRQKTCPMCRKDLDGVEDDFTSHFNQCLAHLSSTAVQQYVDWVYSRGTANCLDDNGLIDPAQRRQFFTKALQLHTVAEAMEDVQFIDNTARSIAIAWNKIAPEPCGARVLFGHLHFKPFINSLYRNKTICSVSRNLFFRGLILGVMGSDLSELSSGASAAAGEIFAVALSMLHGRLDVSLEHAYPEYLKSDDKENQENTEREDDQVNQEI